MRADYISGWEWFKFTQLYVCLGQTSQNIQLHICWIVKGTHGNLDRVQVSFKTDSHIKPIGAFLREHWKWLGNSGVVVFFFFTHMNP